MSQNTSTAVMQRRIEPHDSLDDYPTPPWATRAFVEHVLLPIAGAQQGDVAWEPCCNRGCMAVPLGEYFKVRATDIHDYGWAGQEAVRDFLIEFPEDRDLDLQPDWVIANPPFRLAADFIAKGLGMAQRGAAVLVRVAFPEGNDRYVSLFLYTPPTVIAYYVERVPMVRGRYDPDATTASAYLWMVWVHDRTPQPPVWIPPCRVEMTRPSDEELASRLPVSAPSETSLFDRVQP